MSPVRSEFVETVVVDILLVQPSIFDDDNGTVDNALQSIDECCQRAMFVRFVRLIMFICWMSMPSPFNFNLIVFIDIEIIELVKVVGVAVSHRQYMICAHFIIWKIVKNQQAMHNIYVERNQFSARLGYQNTWHRMFWSSACRSQRSMKSEKEILCILREQISFSHFFFSNWKQFSEYYSVSTPQRSQL